MTRVFGVDYHFLACGDVFTQGLVHAAAALGLDYKHTDWSDPGLSAQVKAFQPDLLFVVHGRKFRKRQARISCPSAVWLLDEPYEVDDTVSWSGQYDQVFVNDQSTLHRHAHASYLPVCYDPVVHHAAGTDRPHAVGFIGGGNSTRDRYLGALADLGILTYAIGGPWSHAGVQRVCRSPNIPASDLPKWYQSTRLVLNVWRETHHFNAQHLPATSLNPRIYEALACGALVVSEWRPEVETLVPDLPTFRTVDECQQLVLELLADPDRARQIQAACWASIQPHTYAQRLTQIVQTCVGVAV
jgi:hypothetical protein